ncbi:protein of unknown function [Methylorubrum extorquens]|uniref:Uncharacterized protein n=1 Tax=Methylorubrum extorquens TaxID=408 RepID=A0A2N9AZF3_METEX|nr:protein of unknown function [Methylorubrum extorquens]
MWQAKQFVSLRSKVCAWAPDRSWTQAGTARLAGRTLSSV